MTETDKAYLAGIIDGEGCITILKRKPKAEGRSYAYTLSVIVCMTSEVVVDWLLERYPKGYKSIQERPNIMHKTQYRFGVDSLNAIELLQDILPYVVEKRDQVLIALDFTKNITPKGTRPTPEINAIREGLYKQLGSMHAHGTGRRAVV
jgi:hypothetical protein